ncbi:MAG: 6-phosphogluconolactonase [Candidatus Eremiobacteraeota bacterium]|nr:6-phosphogluconolactonase [Candidatus Eremiobacteraeota bacterium]
MSGALRVYQSPADVAAALAATFAERAAEAIAHRGRFVVSLAGGTTPKAAYALLAQPPFAGTIDWHAVVVFFGDERCVPPGDDQSNYKMAMTSFLRDVAIPAANVHRMRGEDEPRAAASAYRAELTSILGEGVQFDLVLLGMGPDGHTASLFPGEDPLTGNETLVRAVYSDVQSQWRITLTPRVFNAARAIVFSVEGSAKAHTLAEVRNGPRNPARLPAQIISPTNGTLIWLADDAAASDAAVSG